MVGYKLSKNDWVTPFFVIFRSVREKLLVTVSFDHPVLIKKFKIPPAKSGSLAEFTFGKQGFLCRAYTGPKWALEEINILR